MAGLRQRRNILSMSPGQVADVTGAFNALKQNGGYDDFVRRHVSAMMAQTPLGAQSNAAHCGPIFLPWHRAALWELETALIAINPAVQGLPYWRWQDESALNAGQPRLSKLWTDEYLGPDGDPANGSRVLTGPFKDWQAQILNNTTGQFEIRATTGLVRKLGRDSAGSTTLPDYRQVNDLNTHAVYDVEPYDKTPKSFRNRLEGWSDGPRMHNHVHRWIGGDMLTGTSPNDPVFWLHHANVDLLWWKWQNMSTPRRPYAPVFPAGPVGHRSTDPLTWLLQSTWTPDAVEDIKNTATLGYQYL